MTSNFLVFSFVAQIVLWVFAVIQIEKARAAAWRIYEKEQKLDDIHKASKSYIESVNTEQEAIWRSIDRIERRLKKQEIGENHV